jgi:hypothetical protein
VGFWRFKARIPNSRRTALCVKKAASGRLRLSACGGGGCHHQFQLATSRRFKTRISMPNLAKPGRRMEHLDRKKLKACSVSRREVIALRRKLRRVRLHTRCSPLGLAKLAQVVARSRTARNFSASRTQYVDPTDNNASLKS